MRELTLRVQSLTLRVRDAHAEGAGTHVSPRLKVLSGQQVVRALRSLGFSTVRTRGSHATLTRMTASGRQTITVPLHKELAPGTLQAIYRQAGKFVSPEELRPYFFHD